MLAVPHHRQRTVYTCGPACLRMVLDYFDQPDTEADIAESVGCNSEDGTPPPNMARFLRKRGFVARSRAGLTLADIKADIKRGLPCIIAYQAWSGPGVDLSTTDEHGHYALIVGVGRDRVTLCDPSAKTKRLHIPTQEFLARWHDRCGRGVSYYRWALTVRPRK